MYQTSFHTCEEESSVCFGKYFCPSSCFLVSVKCKRKLPKTSVIPCALNAENLNWRISWETVWYVVKRMGSVLRRKRKVEMKKPYTDFLLETWDHRLVEVQRDLRRPLVQPPTWSWVSYKTRLLRTLSSSWKPYLSENLQELQTARSLSTAHFIAVLSSWWKSFFFYPVGSTHFIW